MYLRINAFFLAESSSFPPKFAISGLFQHEYAMRVSWGSGLDDMLEETWSKALNYLETYIKVACL